MNTRVSPRTIAPEITHYTEELALVLAGPPCLDCNADMEAFVCGSVIALHVMHDDTCPTQQEARK